MKIKTLKILFTGALLVAGSLTCSLSGQVLGVGVRTNVASWALLSPSLGVDVMLPGSFMVTLDGCYGDWGISKSSSSAIRLSSVGLGGRKYFDLTSRGWFVGVDARFLRFNTLKDKIHREGNMITAGVLGGYTFLLGKNWWLDTSVGAGYINQRYDKAKYYPPAGEDRGLGTRKKNTVGLTNLSIAIVYRFNL